jgi:hypothetical protein
MQISSYRRKGIRQYELTGHLCNVRAVIGDRLEEKTDEDGQTAYAPELLSATDYFPFGMQMPGRVFVDGEGYRYGFNGMEKENAVNEDGYDFGARLYNSWNGRWLAVDPVIIKSVIDGKSVFIMYAHLDDFSVEIGDKLEEGQVFGKTGNTGNAAQKNDGSGGIPKESHHVHIEVSIGGDSFNPRNRVDPENYLETNFDSKGEQTKASRISNTYKEIQKRGDGASLRGFLLSKKEQQ